MKQYIVDAFTDKVFSGNPAAVCVMKEWITDELMMEITKENNLSETAFAVKEGLDYKLRWFTPGGEINLCGHATLATAYVITKFVEPELLKINFHTLSGILAVEKKDDIFIMDFPEYELKSVKISDEIIEAIGVEPLEVYIGRDLLCILGSEDEVRNININLDKIKKLDGLLLHVTAKGSEFDCVSRSFAPKLGVSEDPVCGSGHCHIVPFWAKKLDKNVLKAYQASKRGGTLYCNFDGKKVQLSGKAALYSIAEINTDN